MEESQRETDRSRQDSENRNRRMCWIAFTCFFFWIVPLLLFPKGYDEIQQARNDPQPSKGGPSEVGATRSGFVLATSCLRGARWRASVSWATAIENAAKVGPRGPRRPWRFRFGFFAGARHRDPRESSSHCSQWRWRSSVRRVLCCFPPRSVNSRRRTSLEGVERSSQAPVSLCEVTPHWAALGLWGDHGNVCGRDFLKVLSGSSWNALVGLLKEGARRGEQGPVLLDRWCGCIPSKCDTHSGAAILTELDRPADPWSGVPRVS